MVIDIACSLALTVLQLQCQRQPLFGSRHQGYKVVCLHLNCCTHTNMHCKKLNPLRTLERRLSVQSNTGAPVVGSTCTSETPETCAETERRLPLTKVLLVPVASICIDLMFPLAMTRLSLQWVDNNGGRPDSAICISWCFTATTF